MLSRKIECLSLFCKTPFLKFNTRYKEFGDIDLVLFRFENSCGYCASFPKSMDIDFHPSGWKRAKNGSSKRWSFPASILRLNLKHKVWSLIRSDYSWSNLWAWNKPVLNALCSHNFSPQDDQNRKTEVKGRDSVRTEMIFQF